METLKPDRDKTISHPCRTSARGTLRMSSPTAPLERVRKMKNPGMAMRAMGAEASPSPTPEQFDQFLARQIRVVTQLARTAGIEPQ